MKIKHSILQFLIATDQLLNTVLFGYADETLSARCWRGRNKRRWKIAQAVIDRFFYACIGQKDHCYTSYVSERARMQMPPEYRA
jgi:hypothetical protein